MGAGLRPLRPLTQPIGRPPAIIDSMITGLRLPLTLLIQVEQLAATTGYSKSLVMRKLIEGAMRRMLADAETTHDVVIALNRWSRCK